MPDYTLMARGLGGADAPPADWLDARPAAAAGVALGPLTAPHEALEQLQRACYPPGHVDHAQSARLLAEGAYRRLLAGTLIGPLLADASGQAADERGYLVGAVIVVHWQGIASRWPGGPWIADVGVRPEHRRRGVAAALLRRALAACAAAGATRVGLSVTTGNPARSLYDRLGFRPF